MHLFFYISIPVYHIPLSTLSPLSFLCVCVFVYVSVFFVCINVQLSLTVSVTFCLSLGHKMLMPAHLPTLPHFAKLASAVLPYSNCSFLTDCLRCEGEG